MSTASAAGAAGRSPPARRRSGRAAAMRSAQQRWPATAPARPSPRAAGRAGAASQSTPARQLIGARELPSRVVSSRSLTACQRSAGCSAATSRRRVVVAQQREVAVAAASRRRRSLRPVRGGGGRPQRSMRSLSRPSVRASADSVAAAGGRRPAAHRRRRAATARRSRSPVAAGCVSSPTRAARRRGSRSRPSPDASATKSITCSVCSTSSRWPRSLSAAPMLRSLNLPRQQRPVFAQRARFVDRAVRRDDHQRAGERRDPAVDVALPRLAFAFERSSRRAAPGAATSRCASRLRCDLDGAADRVERGAVRRQAACRSAGLVAQHLHQRQRDHRDADQR